MRTKIQEFNDRYFASCPKGLEEVLFKEMESLGATDCELASRGVEFTIEKEQVINVILYSRIASRLYLKFIEFDIKKEKDIYNAMITVDWPRFFKLDQTFKFQFTQGVSPKLKKKSLFTNTQYLSLVAKDALVDKFTEKFKERPNIDIRNPDVLIHCHLEPDDNPGSHAEHLTVMIDLLGETLCHRGYRSVGRMAPIRENLAAGIIDLLNWDPETERFIDLTCGSGTFLLEAVIKKYKIPAKYDDCIYLAKNPNEIIWNFQKYSFLDGLSNNNSFHESIQAGFKKIQELEKIDNPNAIVGNDIKYHTLEDCKATIFDLAWEKVISTRKVDATQFNEFSEDKNFLFCNPPYGERLGDEEKLRDFYYDLGENFKNTFTNSRWSLISSNKNLLKMIRLRPESKHKVSHGSLECFVHEFTLY